jgi:hypothetical protein
VRQVQAAVFTISANWPFFGAHLMMLHGPKCEGMTLPEEVLLAITFTGVMLVNKNTKQPIIMWGYQEVSSYSAGPDRVNLKLGGMMAKDQVNFKATTTQGREICHILNIYSKKNFGGKQ